MQSKGTIVLLSLCIALVLAGCLPSVIHTEHEVILARMQDGVPVWLPDGDPLYARFQEQVLDNPHLGDLQRIFENTTEAFLATNTSYDTPQTVSNHLVVVLDSEQVGVLHDITLQMTQTKVPIELALGLGPEATSDWEVARQQFGSGLSRLLLELVGWDASVTAGATDDPLYTPIYEPTTPSEALTVGFEAALQALYAQRNPNVLAALASQESPTPQEQDLLLRYEAVPRNGLLVRFHAGAPTDELRSPEEARCTPGVVAAFFYQLLQTTNDYYQQRNMLWFVNYEPELVPYAKILLAVSRMSHHRQASVETFIQSYGETFPAEKQAVAELAAQVFGPNQTGGPTP